MTIKYAIELGYSSSSIAIACGGEGRVFKSDIQKETMPSVVSFTRMGTMVGDKAVNQKRKEEFCAITSKQAMQSSTFFEFQRTIGTNKKYETVFHEQPLTSEDLSAEVLKKLKSFVSDDDVRAAVITVPSMFTINQKDATRRAAALADIEHCELLQEPIAASFAYGMSTEKKHNAWLVFDFGCARFDATLVRVENGIMKVVDTDGNNRLGGKDLDLAIADKILLPYLLETYEFSSLQTNETELENWRRVLKKLSEEIKIRLSYTDQFEYMSDLDEFEGITDEAGNEIELFLTITSDALKPVIEPYYDKAIAVCETLLARNNLKGSDLSSVLLVGASTLSPILREMLRERITPQLSTDIDPVTATVRGAALYAYTYHSENHHIPNKIFKESERSLKMALTKGKLIANKYEVRFAAGRGYHCEKYRVKSKQDGTLHLLKLYEKMHVPGCLRNQNGVMNEAWFLRRRIHEALPCYQDMADIAMMDSEYTYFVRPFISGERLLDLVRREKFISVDDALQIVFQLIAGIKALHEQPEPLVCTMIHPAYIVLDYTSTEKRPLITEMGCARTPESEITDILVDDLTVNFFASELFEGYCCCASDQYALGAVLYFMIFGEVPWSADLPGETVPINQCRKALDARKKPLNFSDVNEDVVSRPLQLALSRALAFNADERFCSLDDFLNALQNKPYSNKVEKSKNTVPGVDAMSAQDNADRKQAVRKTIRHKGVRGFAAIAGMDELKRTLQVDVINALKDKELYSSYGVTVPNGMLLYGPPGCGKTFFAQRLAEEVGYRFTSVKPSDLASIYVHGSQGKIGKLFDEAAQHAPAIIFFDEMDALIPSREGNLQHSYASEVNEFLAQMTNCSERNIFIIAATNRPERMDKAILRTGRLDKIIYVGTPDPAARMAMIELYLKKRPFDFDIDYERLAELTENYVSSDIKFLVDEASRSALLERSRIGMKHLVAAIERHPPSISFAEIEKYRLMRKNMESQRS